MRNVTIENLDYADCVKRYDSKDSLFCVDCPYYGSEYYYSKDSFSQDDHFKLSGLLHGIKGKVRFHTIKIAYMMNCIGAGIGTSIQASRAVINRQVNQSQKP
ncbi:site-specific DNA methylase [Candidatus Brocadia pituitae]|nr:site-specific DNA methylase [Candidatus Brocadia pituitae]